MPTMVILLLIPYLIGFFLVLVSSMGVTLSMQEISELYKNAKQRAIRRSALGSVCCGVSFAVLIFQIEMVSPAIESSIFTRILLALLLGLGMILVLFGGALFHFMWFESVTIPNRRRLKERSEAKKGE